MPGCISPEYGVIVRKCSHGGVIKSRFCASEKNANTLSRDCGNQSCDWKFRTRMALSLELSGLARFHKFHSPLVPDHGTNVSFARRAWQRAIVHRNNHLRLEITIHRQPRQSRILSVGYCAASHQDDVGMIEFLDQ